jgi:fluoroacetyl-CoA thioesterase
MGPMTRSPPFTALQPAAKCPPLRGGSFARAYNRPRLFRKSAAMKRLAPGATGSFTLEVKPEHLANRFKDAILPPVLATPVMILVMENAALNAIRGALDPGESAVGTRIDVKHTAATPAGMRVTGEAELTRVDGRRLEFRVRARDEQEEIGSGTHERVVVDVARLAKRLADKRPG